MRFALISDIHGNLEALTVALEAIDKRGVDSIVCLGDIVGYGADPVECLDIVRAKASTVILGNHDAAAIGSEDLAYFNDKARSAALWTQAVLSAKDKDYLRTLPLLYLDKDLHFVHGTPLYPEDWNYIFTAYDTQGQYEAIQGEVCFVGHSHVPGDFKEKRDDTGTGKRIINVGSVGQPRDRDPRLCCAIYDTESKEVEFVREEYDIKSAAAKIRKAGLPVFLAERLEWGY